MKEHGNLASILSSVHLKITPQRLAVMDALVRMRNHPTADQITEFIKVNHPHIATGTIYKTLETFVMKGLIRKVKTDRDVMRYDPVMDHHHHLYCARSDRIEDFTDPELQQIIEQYFNKKKIPGFAIADIRLQIIGEFSADNGTNP